jgi:hypothetical protein
MRRHPVVVRTGAGLIDTMVRSAVLSGSPSVERKLPGLWRRREAGAAAEEASIRFHQLCELTEAGVLSETEFAAAVERLTEPVRKTAARRGRAGRIGSLPTAARRSRDPDQHDLG